MGKYKLFDDYLMRINLSHLEVLREMKYFGIDDDRLLVPALFYLGSERGKSRRRGVNSELTSLTRGDVAHMLELSLLLRKLRGHNYNIFECCFLAIADLDKEAKLLCMAAFSLIAQILLLIILMHYNMRDITNVTLSNDWGTIVVVVITTFFFAKLAHAQWREASDFNAVFWKAGFPKRYIDKVEKRTRKALLWINIFINGVLGAVVVLFNIFFLLISKNVNEAILNSLSLFFILEMDDTLKPDWDELEFDCRIAMNVWRYMTGGGDVDVQVDIISSTASEEDYLCLLQSDDRVNFKATEDNDQLVVNVYWKRSYSNYEKIQFQISGANGTDFFDCIKEFRCVERDVQLLSFINWLLNQAESNVSFNDFLLDR
jgi:hypothetical protein